MKISLNENTLNCNKCGSDNFEIINIDDEGNCYLWCNDCDNPTVVGGV